MNKYIPKNIEFNIINIWNNNIKKNEIKNNKIYSILLPPPNITGSLHIGHILQYVVMDFIARYNKMLNKNVMIKFGLDHGGIATQILIEKLSNNINNNKNLLIYNANIWKKKIEKKIKNQIKKIGILIDFNKNRFTLDNHYKYAINKVFFKLYNDNLIYKAKKIVNWDIKLKTAISDLEVINKKELNYIWHIKYFFQKDKDKFIVVSTTRPETIFGDSAIAVNPNDIRYKNIIGKNVFVPLINRIIPIISDNNVDISKETGCMKVTPAHDFIDYEIGIKNKLKFINIFNVDGTIKDKLEIYDDIYSNNIEYENIPNIFKNLDVCKLKIEILKLLNIENFIYNKKISYINIKYNHRNLNRIELLITNQWFLKTKYIYLKSIEILNNNNINIFPKKYKNNYIEWYKNIKDWCISRQIWWGHKIPVWYDIENKIEYLGLNEKYIRNKFKINKNIKLVQDNSVLDTWFSSSIWSFVSLGWPNITYNFIKNYPYNIVISGFDIIFFWISKMIIMSLYVFKDNDRLKIPFKNIYITGLMVDCNGNKMSKSNNNTIDPLNIINGNFKENKLKGYIGSDALRFSLLSISNTNKYINFNYNKLFLGKKFCNKLWNINTFIFNNIDYLQNNINNIKLENISIFDKWIIFNLEEIINDYKRLIENNRIDLLTNKLYHFVWNKFSNYYIEFYKILNKEYNEKLNNNIFIYIYESIIKILHPMIPFITEKIWIDINKKYYLNNKEYILINNNFPINIFNINLNNIISLNYILNLINELRSINYKLLNNNIIIYIKNDIYIFKKYINLIKIMSFIKNNIYFNEDLNINKPFIIKY